MINIFNRDINILMYTLHSEISLEAEVIEDDGTKPNSSKAYKLLIRLNYKRPNLNGRNCQNINL